MKHRINALIDEFRSEILKGNYTAKIEDLDDTTNWVCLEVVILGEVFAFNININSSMITQTRGRVELFNFMDYKINEPYIKHMWEKDIKPILRDIIDKEIEELEHKKSKLTQI